MADALAISAAVIQFLDIAIRLSVKLTWICSELKDVPHWLDNLKKDLSQQIVIAQHLQFVQANLSSCSSTGGSSNLAIDQALADYVRILARLDHIIQSIPNGQSAGALKKRWDALLAVHKRREILLLCENLEQKKSTISLWLCSASVKFSSQILENIGCVRSAIDTMLDLSTKLDKTASNAHAQLGHLPNLVPSVDKTSSEVALLANANVSHRETTLKLMSEMRTDVQTLIQEWGSVQPMLRDCRTILDDEYRQVRTSHQISAPVMESSALVAEYQRPGIENSLGYISSQGPRWNINTATRDLAQLTTTLCRCNVYNQIAQVEPFPNVHLRKVIQRHHYRQCPKSSNSERSVELMIRIILPAWLLSHIINLSMAISWGSNRGWKISPVILGTSRIVNSNESPAFKGIRQTRTLLRSTRFKDSQHQVRALETTLRDLFQGYIASPLDEDSAGNTLLYEVLKLVCVHNLEDVSRSVGFAGPEYLSLIRYLLDSGANPNVLQSPNKADFFVMGGGTALDMSAWSFVSATNRQTRTTFGHATYLQLVKDGGYFSRAIDGPKRRHPIHWFQNFKTEFRIFQQFAEQSEVHGSFTELIIAIIQQSESDLKREIFRCDVNHVSPENGLSAIHFAIYWPLALRELINAGANVNCQDHYGRRPVHLAVACGQREAVEILIAADCSLFTPHYSNSLLQESLRNGRDFDQTTNVIVDALVSRHTRLVNLALSTLPDTSELKTELIVGTVWEIMAPQIANELAACNQQIPAALKLHRDGEGVYDTAELHADIRLTIPLAERLWRGGFLRINECAPLNGLTPILQAWYSADFEMVSWFIDKGVSPYGKHRDAPISSLHLYAARLSYPGGYFQHQPQAIDTSPRHITQLMQESSCCQDSCSCLCSVGGCSALSTLVK